MHFRPDIPSIRIDPLSEISNALSRLNTEAEVQLFQIVLAPAPTGWRSSGHESRRKCRWETGSGMHKKTSLMKNAGKEIGKGMIGVLSGRNMPTPQSDPSEKQVADTGRAGSPKAIDGKE